MSQAFISYHATERKLARKIAHRVAYAGFGVWWDREDRQGDRWTEAVTMALSRSDAVIVLWSRKSVRSARILGEATAAFGRSVLISVLVDGTPPPPPFDSVPIVDAEGWNGDAEDLAWMRLQEHLSALLVQSPPAPAARVRSRPLDPLYPTAPHDIPERGGAGPAVLASVAAVVALGAAGWAFREHLPSPAEGLDWARDRLEDLRAPKPAPKPPVPTAPTRVHAADAAPAPTLEPEAIVITAPALSPAAPAANVAAAAANDAAVVPVIEVAQPKARIPVVAPPVPPAPLVPLDETIPVAAPVTTSAEPETVLDSGLY